MKHIQVLGSAVVIALSLASCGTSGLTAPPVTQTQTATPVVQNVAPLLEQAGIKAALEQNLKVLDSTAIEIEGRQTAYFNVQSLDGTTKLLLVADVNGVIRVVLLTPKQGSIAVGEPTFTSEELGLTNGSKIQSQGISDWLFERLVDVIGAYNRAPSWAKWATKGPAKAVIKMLIGAAINYGCNSAFNALSNYLQWNGRWVPVGKTVFCDIIAG